jgi:hypothetical protein
MVSAGAPLTCSIPGWRASIQRTSAEQASASWVPACWAVKSRVLTRLLSALMELA